MDVPKVVPAPNEGPERFESGTLNSEGMAGTTAAVNFIAGLSDLTGASRNEKLDDAMDGVARQEMVLLERLWDGLAGVEAVTLYGPPPSEDRAPTLSFTVDGKPARDVSAALANDVGAFLSHGNFYAATVVDRLGLQPHGMVRAGICLYTTEEEVDRVVNGVRDLVNG
jgi:selenocysteine lyase/cysteine desulfurase